MRVVEADVPAGIMPAKINASLIDIKIGGKRGPDDALYNKSQVMRELNLSIKLLRYRMKTHIKDILICPV